MTNFINICSLFLLSILLLFSCAGLRNRIQPERDIRMAAESRFDPLGFAGDDSVITGRNRMSPAQTDTIDGSANSLNLSSQEQPNNPDDHVLFRVQVYSTKLFDDAQQYSSSIKTMFPEGVSVEYQMPYYKVQVGQFNNSADGQSFLEKVKQLGFENAWLVRITQ
jgi:hypothetical protein